MSKPMFKVRWFYLYLADNEWGNELMRQVAAETFAAHPDVDVVEVFEHAGWYLAWNRSMDIVETANDGARLSDAAREWWKTVGNARPSDYAGCVRRQDLVDESNRLPRPAAADLQTIRV